MRPRALMFRGWCFAAWTCCLLASSFLPAATVSPLDADGPPVARFGWDIKAWPERLNSAAEASYLYGQLPANLLRIPIFANAHAEDGTVDTAQYATELTSIRNVIRANPNVEVFASLKLLGADTFPDWLDSTTNGSIFGNTVKKPIAAKYGQLLADYVQYMQSEGIEIDFLGPLNETDGAVEPARFVSTVNQLDSQLVARGIPLQYRDFKIVGPDAFSLATTESYIDTLDAQGNLGVIDVVGSHFYPQHSSGSENDWTQIKGIIGNKPLWHTELHMPVGNDDYTGIPHEAFRDAMSVLFASNRRGADSFVWWDSAPLNSTTIGYTLKRELIRTMVDATPLQTTPGYAAKGDAAGSVLFQAYVHDDEITLWIANPGAARNSEIVNLDVGTIVGTPQGTYWEGNANTITGHTGNFVFQPGLSSFRIVQIPAQSTGYITFRFATIAGDYDRDGLVDAADYDLWQASLGSTSSLMADGNFDGVVDAADYTIWRDNLGSTALAWTPTSIPEPASWILGIAASTWLCAPRRRRATPVK